jgi:hypothetical protein
MSNLKSFTVLLFSMSFANEWLRYLESRKGEWVRHLMLVGDIHEDMPYTEISIDTEGLKQYLPHKEGMRIPDKIGIDPIETKSVEIITSDNLTFYISKDKKMRIRYADSSGRGFSDEKKKALIKEAKNHGYKVTEFVLTDV